MTGKDDQQLRATGMVRARFGRARARGRAALSGAAGEAIEALEGRRLLAAAAAAGPILQALDFRPLPSTAARGADVAAAATSLFGVKLALGPSRTGAPAAVAARSLAPFTLDRDVLAGALAAAPLEFAPGADAGAIVLPLPAPDGSMARFKVVEAPIMEPALAAQFPDIKTYRGYGVDDPAATVRLDLTPLGFHAQVLSVSGAYYIDPYFRNDAAGTYASYYKRDALADADHALYCDVEGHDHDDADDHDHGDHDHDDHDHDAIAARDESASAGDESSSLVAAQPLALTFGGQLKTYRAAVATSGEYTAAVGGGTVGGGQAAVVTAMNRVTGVYETELAIRLVLVANNSSLIYTNANSDPYSNTSPSTLLTQNQSNIDSVIGSANYDIGHVFTTGGGGLAGLGVVGKAGQKARGETGLPSPTGDAFYVDYVAHEMGHQFGGNHTFNGTQGNTAGGNRNGATAYEPGSGSSIMGYAGISGTDDLQPHSDPFFHSVSIDEIRAYIGTVPAVGTASSTGNLAPAVSAGSDYTVPAGTPFALTATGSDPDGDAVTYDWQQRDLGAARPLTTVDPGAGPLFRTWAPTTSPTRLLPRLSSILAGSNTTAAPTGGGWVEQLYVAGRTSTWRVIARDNRIGGGGVTTDDMTLTVVNTGAAFAVTAPNSAVTWFAGQGHTVSWNVAGTTGGGINAASVKILLSTDGGTTFPHVLAASTSNDGSELVTLPAGLTSTTARVKIEAVGNVFFDLSNANFTIGNGTPPPGAIAGQAYEDRDADGAFGGGDLPLQNVVVYLDKNDNGVLDAGGPSPEPASTTNALGTYSFASVGAGTHKVRAQLPAGYVATAPVGGAASVTVSSGATATQNFGQFPTVYAGTGAADSYTLRLSQPAAAAHYTDDFNRAALAGGSNVYTTQVSAGDGAASITANDVLTLTNDASAAVANAAGQVYVTTPTSAFAGFNPHLHANAAPIAWSFNVQQVRTDPGGLSGTSYGVAYVLGATNGTFVGTGAGNGYAVVIGNSGSVDPIRLVRFTGGLGGTLTGLASDAAQNATNRHWSVKVTFDPASDQWSLFTRDDGTGGFTNPLGGGTPLVQSGATVADSTYTGAASLLTHAGPYWAYSTSANQAAKFDNITLAPAAGGGGGGASRVEVLLGGVVTYSAPPGLASSLTFNTAGGDDSLVIDYANGNPIPAGGAFYDGGDGGDDALVINGSAAANHVKLSSAFAGPAAQNINLHDAATGARTVEGVTFNGGAGNDSLTVVTAPATGGAGGGATKLTFNGGTAPGETDALNLHAGDWAIGGDLGAATANAAISVSNSGTAVALGATQHLASLAIDGATVTLTADGSRLMNTGALAVTGSGTLDLQDNDLVVRDGGAVSVAGSTYNGVAGLIAAGRVLGSQTSSLAPAARAALAAATASEVLAIAPGDTATWQGETVSGSAVLIKHTYVGDADLNGKINGDDYFAVDSHVASLNPWGWWRGDFDHNARIDGDDYFLIDSNIARQGAAL